MLYCQGGDDPIGGVPRRKSECHLCFNRLGECPHRKATNTNFQVVSEVVRQYLDAGARKVIVTDVSCNDPNRCFQRSGIAEAARQAGAEVLVTGPVPV